METPAHIAAQRIVGGSLALDLLNTQNGPAGGAPEDDAIRDYGDVVAWAAYVGMLGPDDAERLLRAGTPPSRPPLARSTSASSRPAATCTRRSTRSRAAGRPRPPPSRRLRDDEADALAHAELVRDRRRLRVALGGRRPGPTAVAGDPRGAAAPDRGPARSRQGLRDVPVPLPRPEQEPEPPVVLDGGLRHRRQDAQVRRAAGVRALGNRRLAQQLEPVEVDAAVAERRGSGSCAARSPPRSPGRRPAGTAPSRRRGRPSHGARRRWRPSARPNAVPLAATQATSRPVKRPRRPGGPPSPTRARARRGSRGPRRRPGTRRTGAAPTAPRSWRRPGPWTRRRRRPGRRTRRTGSPGTGACRGGRHRRDRRDVEALTGPDGRVRRRRRRCPGAGRASAAGARERDDERRRAALQRGRRALEVDDGRGHRGQRPCEPNLGQPPLRVDERRRQAAVEARARATG